MSGNLKETDEAIQGELLSVSEDSLLKEKCTESERVESTDEHCETGAKGECSCDQVSTNVGEKSAIDTPSIPESEQEEKTIAEDLAELNLCDMAGNIDDQMSKSEQTRSTKVKISDQPESEEMKIEISGVKEKNDGIAKANADFQVPDITESGENEAIADENAAKDLNVVMAESMFLDTIDIASVIAELDSLKISISEAVNEMRVDDSKHETVADEEAVAKSNVDEDVASVIAKLESLQISISEAINGMGVVTTESEHETEADEEVVGKNDEANSHSELNQSGASATRNCHMRIINDGLKVAVNQEEKNRLFSYAISIDEQCKSTSWLQLRNIVDFAAENIYIQNLHPEDKLINFFEKVQHNMKIKALILISEDNNYHITEEFLEGSENGVDFPYLVIRKTDGECIMQLLGYFEVYAMVNAETEVDPPPKSHRGFCLRLERTIKSDMFCEDDNPVVMTLNIDKFAKVMSAFDNYEKHVQASQLKESSGVIKKLKMHMDYVFKSDFLFYIILIHRMHCKNFYCFQHFGDYFLMKLEQLDPQSVAEVILSFTSSSNFIVDFDYDGEKEKDAFRLLKLAWLTLAEHSSERKFVKDVTSFKTLFLGHKPRLLPNFVYTQMLCVSASMKFHQHCSPKLSSAHDEWKKYFTDYRFVIKFNSSNIQELIKGLKFGNLLELPSEIACRTDHLADLMATKTGVRPFIEVT